MDVTAKKIPEKKKTELLEMPGVRKIKQARFHETVFWPGKFNMENNLKAEMHKGLSMWWIPNDCLLLTFGNEGMSIPLANVVEAVHE